MPATVITVAGIFVFIIIIIQLYYDVLSIKTL